METNTSKQRTIWSFRNFLILVASFVAIFLLCVIAFMLNGPLYGEIKNLDLIPTTQPFTELYFENSAFLPKQTIQGSSMSFVFSIHNQENVTMIYPYQVYFEYPDGNKVTFASSTVLLNNNASTSIAISHVFLNSDEVGKVVVDLTSLNQQIDFLLNDNN